MGYECRIEADSTYFGGPRITTMVVKFPAIIQAQVLTHRAFSRNSSSMRAIPVSRLIEKVKKDPFIPKTWRQAQRGMQPGQPLNASNAYAATHLWKHSLDQVLAVAQGLDALGASKEHVNRLLHPWSWVEMILTATDWDNFFALRCDHAAQEEMQTLANLMKQSLNSSSPRRLDIGEWHLPFITEEEKTQYPLNSLIRLSVARCARVSYLTHDGKRDPERDFQLADQLISDGHLSPLEHAATPDPDIMITLAWAKDLRESWVKKISYHANLHGWISARHYSPSPL